MSTSLYPSSFLCPHCSPSLFLLCPSHLPSFPLLSSSLPSVIPPLFVMPPLLHILLTPVVSSFFCLRCLYFCICCSLSYLTLLSCLACTVLCISLPLTIRVYPFFPNWRLSPLTVISLTSYHFLPLNLSSSYHFLPLSLSYLLPFSTSKSLFLLPFSISQSLLPPTIFYLSVSLPPTIVYLSISLPPSISLSLVVWSVHSAISTPLFSLFLLPSLFPLSSLYLCISEDTLSRS